MKRLLILIFTLSSIGLYAQFDAENAENIKTLAQNKKSPWVLGLGGNIAFQKNSPDTYKGQLNFGRNLHFLKQTITIGAIGEISHVDGSDANGFYGGYFTYTLPFRKFMERTRLAFSPGFIIGRTYGNDIVNESYLYGGYLAVTRILGPHVSMSLIWTITDTSFSFPETIPVPNIEELSVAATFQIQYHF